MRILIINSIKKTFMCGQKRWEVKGIDTDMRFFAYIIHDADIWKYIQIQRGL